MNRSTRRSAGYIIFALLFASSALASSSTELTPGGTGDDTAQLQAALSKCSHAKKPCHIRLGAGVFHTDVLLVKGFSGSITGRGQGRTIIRPILSRPLRSTLNPFFAEPTAAQPYPALLHFADGGRISLSAFTMDFPEGLTVSPYNYYLLVPFDVGLGITDYLLAAIMVEGDRNAELRVSHVTVTGRDVENYWGSNLAQAVRFTGKLRFTGDPVNYTDRTQKLQRGRFVAHDNRLIRVGNGLWAEDTNNTEGLFYDNEIDVSAFGVNMVNAGNSSYQTLRNRIRAGSDGVLVFQTLQRPPEDPSRYVIALNRIRAADGALDGIAVVDDAAAEGLTGTMDIDADIWGNDIVLEGEVLDGIEIFSDGPGEVRVFGNRIRGTTPLDSGIWVEFSEGTFVAGNDLRAIDPPFGDVSLRETASGCRVIEPGDTVQDLGTNNQVIGVPLPPAADAARAAANTALAATARARPRIGFPRKP